MNKVWGMISIFENTKNKMEHLRRKTERRKWNGDGKRVNCKWFSHHYILIIYDILFSLEFKFLSFGVHQSTGESRNIYHLYLDCWTRAKSWLVSRVSNLNVKMHLRNFFIHISLFCQLEDKLNKETVQRQSFGNSNGDQNHCLAASVSHWTDFQHKKWSLNGTHSPSMAILSTEKEILL